MILDSGENCVRSVLWHFRGVWDSGENCVRSVLVAFSRSRGTVVRTVCRRCLWSSFCTSFFCPLRHFRLRFLV